MQLTKTIDKIINDSRHPFFSQPGGNLVHEFRGATSQYILSELERRKSELKPQLVWIGAQKEPGITSRTWKWVNGMTLKITNFSTMYATPNGNANYRWSSAEASMGQGPAK